MATDATTGARRFDPPSRALVVGGRYRFGTYDRPLVVNPFDSVTATGWRGRLERVVRDLRMKEWEAFQLGNDEWFVLGAVYDAKLVGIVMVIAVHQATGRIHRWIHTVPSFRVSVPRGLDGTVARGRSRTMALSIANEVGAGTFTVEGHHRGDRHRPALRLTGTADGSRPGTRHLVTCHPFSDRRALYSNKCLMAFEGVLEIGGEVVTFAAHQSFLILDDHHGEYPSPQVYDWVTAARRQEDGSLLGFNLTANQVRDPAVHNENVLWVDGEIFLLPAVRFHRPEGVGGPWHVTDAERTVEVTFHPTVRSTLHVGPGRCLAEYHAPYGRVTGHLPAGDRRVSVDGLFGMGEKKRIRL